MAPDIRLSKEEREQLRNIVRAGKNSARVQTRARILLLAAERSISSRGGKTRRSNSNSTIGRGSVGKCTNGLTGSDNGLCKKD